MSRVLVDVSQWAHWPATTGIQRVLGHLAANWSGGDVDASFGVVADGAYSVGPIADFAAVLRSRFEGSTRTDAGGSALAALRAISDGAVPTGRLAETFDGFLLAEPTLRADSLSVFAGLSATSSVVPFALYFDALPMTHPQFFPRGADRRRTRYHLAVSRIEDVVFISERTRRVFETRLARRRLRNSLVARPGADALPAGRRTTPETPRFCMVGSIEPRKRYPVALDVFERLWAAGRPYELVVLGRAAWETRDVLERLERLSRSRPLEWIAEADDGDVLEAVSSSTALLFLGEAEGYGLPPMEALSVGCPVIVSADLPALEDLPADGQIRLAEVTPEHVYAAVERLADPVLNAQYRTAIETLELPTWERFAETIETWIVRRLLEGRIPRVA
jgi:glycosyltransferase involved in cell wall biosynthesis